MIYKAARLALRVRAFLFVSGLGYISAAVGLVVELLVSAKHGATAETDTYRWCGLILYNAIGVICTFAVPVIMRSRTVSRRTWPPCSLVISPSNVIAVNPYVVAWLFVTAVAAVILCATNLIIPSDLVSILVAATCSLFIIGLAVVGAPAFFAGQTGVAIGFNVIVNTSLAVSVYFMPSLHRAMSVAYVGASFLCAVVILYLLVVRVNKAFIPTLYKRSFAPEPLGQSFFPLARSTVATSFASAAYYSMLSFSAPGLLSIYVTMSKASMLLSAPTNAIMNSFIRRDFVGRDHNVSAAVDRVVSAALPVAFVTPAFAAIAYLLLSLVYGIAPDGADARMLQLGVPVVLCSLPITICFGMLVLSRHTARHTAYPALIAAGVAATFWLTARFIPDPTYVIMLPPLGATITALISLFWVSNQIDGSPRKVILLLLICVTLGLFSAVILTADIVSDLVLWFQVTFSRRSVGLEHIR